MAEYSAPFDGSPIATQIQWSRMARYWGVDGIHANTNVVGSCKVVANGTATLTIGAGKAYVNGYFYHNISAKLLTVPPNTGSTPRVDLVVLRADPTSANKVSAEYKQGGATAPSLQQDDDGIWEIPLAQITVAGGASAVPAGNVVDLRWFTDRGIAPSNPLARRSPTQGQVIVEGTSLYVGDGAKWNWLASGGVEDAAYTPKWTVSNGATTINWGSGSVNIGRYQAVRKRVDVTIQLQPTGNPVPLDDPIEVSLPPNLPATTAHRALFTWFLESGNGEGQMTGTAVVFPTISSSRTARMVYPVSNGNSTTSMPAGYSLRTNFPVNIRANDILTIDGSYWLA